MQCLTELTAEGKVGVLYGTPPFQLDFLQWGGWENENKKELDRIISICGTPANVNTIGYDVFHFGLSVQDYRHTEDGDRGVCVVKPLEDET
jgi:hypothetical protein